MSKITLAHGNGGAENNQLIKEVFYEAFKNEIFQWLNFEESMNLPEDVKEHTKEEVADIAIYLLRICMKLDINLEEAILNKMTKNEKKYPVETSQGGSKKYSKSREDK